MGSKSCNGARKEIPQVFKLFLQVLVCALSLFYHAFTHTHTDTSGLENGACKCDCFRVGQQVGFRGTVCWENPRKSKGRWVQISVRPPLPERSLVGSDFN